MEMAAPLTSEGMASGTMTLKIICALVEPMDCAASRMPWFTSCRELSTMRATYGKALTTNGTIRDSVPIALPIMARVTGNSIASRMMNG